MKAVRVHAYHREPRIDDIPEPTPQGPLDVIVKIGGAGVCRTDLHLRRARLTRVSIEGNSGTCRDLLTKRYAATS